MEMALHEVLLALDLNDLIWTKLSYIALDEHLIRKIGVVKRLSASTIHKMAACPGLSGGPSRAALVSFGI